MSITHKVENRRGRINLVSFRLQIKSAHVELGKMNKELIRNALLGKLANYQNFLNQQFFNKNDTDLNLFSQPLIHNSRPCKNFYFAKQRTKHYFNFEMKKLQFQLYISLKLKVSAFVQSLPAKYQLSCQLR